MQRLSRPINLFYCYERADRALRDELDRHLGILKRQSLLASWYDREINAGADRRKEINNYLNTAHIILLLISPDFIASDYCYSIEMKRAIDRHNAGEACVIPIILRPVSYEEAPFSALEPLPTDAKPVTSWPDRDQAFLDIVNGIRKSVKDFSVRLEKDAHLHNSASLKTKEQWLDIGDAYYRAYQYEEALDAYDQALLLDPDHLSAHAYRGHALYNLKRYEGAIISYNQAIRLDANDAELYRNRGNSLYNLQRYHEALANHEEAIRLDPGDVQHHINKSTNLYRLSLYRKALEVAEEAIHLDATYANALHARANALYSLRRYTEALESYDQAIKLDPEDGVFHRSRGNTLKSLGRLQESQEAYAKAKELGYDG